MRLGAVHPQLTVPPVCIDVEALLLDHCVKLAQILLSCTSTDELTDSWNEHIESLHSLAVVIGLHVECLEVLREVIDANWALEHLLCKVSLVLTAHIDTPEGLLFELLDLLGPEMLE